MSAPQHPDAKGDIEPTIGSYRRQRHRLQSLQKTIETTYDTVLQVVPLRGITVELLRVADVDTLLDRLPYLQFRPDDRLPYWADLWPSSLALAQYIWDAVETQGLPVLELGCGLGLAGMIACRKGGTVTFTDYEADALAFTRYNVLRNHCRGAVVQHLDWHAPQLSQTYTLIMASDVFYERANFLPLLHVLETALASDGQLVLAEPNRPIGRDFFRMLRDRGFQYERSTVAVELDNERHDVSIYHGRRKHPHRVEDRTKPTYDLAGHASIKRA